MGGSFSEPSTLCDLGENTRRFYTDQRVAQRIGWILEPYRSEQLVAGIQHVDDCWLSSGVFCTQCLEHGLRALWPHDVGVECEESGRKVRFLATCIEISQAQEFIITPFNPNADYAHGRAVEPKVSRLVAFVDQQQSDKRTLKQFVIGQILQYNAIVAGDATHTREAFETLGRECLRLGWPAKWLGQSLLCIARKHHSPFVDIVRKVGRLLRSDHDLPWSLDNVYGSELGSTNI